MRRSLSGLLLAAVMAPSGARGALGTLCPATAPTLPAGPGRRRVLRVGRGLDFDRPSQAASAARDGDVIEMEPGDYRGDAAIWRAHGLTLRARQGEAHLHADGAHVQGKAIWVIQGNGTVVEGLVFSGCRVPDRNGAGIRQEGAGLVLRRCRFIDNENGLLAGANPCSDILVEQCEFGRNGRGDGYTHNLYVGAVRSLTVRYCHLHDANGGHCLKSRAVRTVVVCNRIGDGPDGRSSYEVEFPDGGIALLVGNLIEQGRRTRNVTLVSYGVEGLTHPLNELHAAHNTLVNERTGPGRFFFVATGTRIASLVNNVYLGNGRIVDGPAQQSGGHQLSRPHGGTRGTGAPRLPAMLPPAPTRSIVQAGVAHGIPLAPEFEYVHPRSHRQRSDHAQPVAGAFSRSRAPMPDDPGWKLRDVSAPPLQD